MALPYSFYPCMQVLNIATRAHGPLTIRIQDWPDIRLYVWTNNKFDQDMDKSGSYFEHCMHALAIATYVIFMFGVHTESPNTEIVSPTTESATDGTTMDATTSTTAGAATAAAPSNFLPFTIAASLSGASVGTFVMGVLLGVIITYYMLVRRSAAISPPAISPPAIRPPIIKTASMVTIPTLINEEGVV